MRTFEAAAYLKKIGADTVAVKLLFSNSIDAYKRKAQIVASARVHGECAIAVADFKSDDIRVVAPQAADELLGISGVGASTSVIYKTGSTVNISGRSSWCYKCSGNHGTARRRRSPDNGCDSNRKYQCSGRCKGSYCGN